MANNYIVPKEPREGTNGGSRTACAISGKPTPTRSMVMLGNLRPSLVERIHLDHPALLQTSMISRAEADRYRALYVEDLLLAEHGELTVLDREVAQSLAHHDTIAEDVERNYAECRTFGDRVSDQLAYFAGSWHFLIGFAVALAGWVVLNAMIGSKAIDPYPFIFLNLILSCVAAFQAPVIIMSQRRGEEKDRLRAQGDYRVNLKAELEIRHLHEKLDHLISKQWQRLVEIQQIQLESMQQNRLRAERAPR